MTKRQRIVNHLHAADKELRKAMVLAGDLIVDRKEVAMRLVTDAVRESEWYLDEALAHVEIQEWTEKTLKKIYGKDLTASRKRGRMSA